MNNSYILFFLIITIFIFSCEHKPAMREPRNSYAADMTYSRAYETYTSDSFFRTKVGDKRPVGTVKRGQELPIYYGQNTVEGYEASAHIFSPYEKFSPSEKKEAKRLFNIYCAECHGEKLNGNGHLYNNGNGPFIAKPAVLVGESMAPGARFEGTIFHVMTYGRNLMGSYASQLSSKQRWMIVDYIKTEQAKHGYVQQKSNQPSNEIKQPTVAQKQQKNNTSTKKPKKISKKS